MLVSPWIVIHITEKKLLASNPRRCSLLQQTTREQERIFVRKLVHSVLIFCQSHHLVTSQVHNDTIYLLSEPSPAQSVGWTTRFSSESTDASTVDECCKHDHNRSCRKQACKQGKQGFPSNSFQSASNKRMDYLTVCQFCFSQSRISKDRPQNNRRS